MVLAQIFLKSVANQAAASGPEAALEQRLRSIWEEGVRAWPDFTLPVEDFVLYLSGHMRGPAPEKTWDERLQEIHAVDLFLAAACMRQDPVALKVFDRVYLRRVSGWLSSFDNLTLIDEVRQVLRVRMLVGEDAQGGKLRDYAGRGSLLNWLRTAAFRIALNQREGSTYLESEPARSQLEGGFLTGQDPELAYIKARYLTEFKDALRTAFATLSTEARNLLRMNIVGGLSTRQIAAMMNMSQPTVARRLAEAREDVRAETCRLLSNLLRISKSEFESLAMLVQSQLDISLEAELR